jgi:hypothetical protein
VNRCQGMTRAGGPCRVALLPGEAWCWIHHPDKAAERAAARRKGGINRRTVGTVIASLGVTPPASLDDMPSVQAAINFIWTDTLRQENTGSRSRTLVAIALAAVRCLEVGEIEERLKALEQANAQRPGRAA